MVSGEGHVAELVVFVDVCACVACIRTPYNVGLLLLCSSHTVHDHSRCTQMTTLKGSCSWCWKYLVRRRWRVECHSWTTGTTVLEAQRRNERNAA